MCPSPHAAFDVGRGVRSLPRRRSKNIFQETNWILWWQIRCRLFEIGPGPSWPPALGLVTSVETVRKGGSLDSFLSQYIEPVTAFQHACQKTAPAPLFPSRRKRERLLGWICTHLDPFPHLVRFSYVRSPTRKKNMPVGQSIRKPISEKRSFYCDRALCFALNIITRPSEQGSW